MKSCWTLLLVLSCASSKAQDRPKPRAVDTILSFWGNQDLRGHDYYNRVVPAYSNHPLYAGGSYPYSTHPRFEFFRIDSSHYLYYEYFFDRDQNGNDGIRQQGIYQVRRQISDSSSYYIDLPDLTQQAGVTYFRQLTREGPWEELDDSTFGAAYWIGSYQNNKRTGIWKHLINDNSDDSLEIEAVDYRSEPPSYTYRKNLGRSADIPTIKSMLIGRWKLGGCDADSESRMNYDKCQTYHGAYGDDCNNAFNRDNYYGFVSKTKFERQRGEGCYAYKDDLQSGTWDIIEEHGVRVIQVVFHNGASWRLRILYLDKENLVTDRL